MSVDNTATEGDGVNDAVSSSSRFFVSGKPPHVPGETLCGKYVYHEEVQSPVIGNVCLIPCTSEETCVCAAAAGSEIEVDGKAVRLIVSPQADTTMLFRDRRRNTTCLAPSREQALEDLHGHGHVAY